VNSRRSRRRVAQLAYSELQAKTHDEDRRRRKASKIVAVLQHYLGSHDLTGLIAVDLGCSTGFTVDALRATGCDVLGVDIDVPGLVHARSNFGDRGYFVCSDGGLLPLGDRSVDIIVFNHIYEHVVDPDQVLSEIRRVLKDDGIVYLGLGNKRGIIEPHYRLPFLSWLPRALADKYVAAMGRADDYYEQFRTRRGLKRMCAPLNLWDYTYTVLAESARFKASDMVPRRMANLPARSWYFAAPLMPTFLWVGTPGNRRPAGAPTKRSPALLRVTS